MGCRNGGIAEARASDGGDGSIIARAGSSRICESPDGRPFGGFVPYFFCFANGVESGRLWGEARLLLRFVFYFFCFGKCAEFYDGSRTLLRSSGDGDGVDNTDAHLDLWRGVWRKC